MSLSLDNFNLPVMLKIHARKPDCHFTLESTLKKVNIASQIRHVVENRMINSFRFRIGWTILVIVALGLSITGSTLAGYLDPGSGSIIIQVVIAAILGLLVTIRVYWSRITGFIGGHKAKPDDDATANPTHDDTV